LYFNVSLTSRELQTSRLEILTYRLGLEHLRLVPIAHPYFLSTIYCSATNLPVGMKQLCCESGLACWNVIDGSLLFRSCAIFSTGLLLCQLVERCTAISIYEVVSWVSLEKLTHTFQSLLP